MIIFFQLEAFWYIDVFYPLQAIVKGFWKAIWPWLLLILLRSIRADLAKVPGLWSILALMIIGASQPSGSKILVVFDKMNRWVIFACAVSPTLKLYVSSGGDQRTSRDFCYCLLFIDILANIEVVTWPFHKANHSVSSISVNSFWSFLASFRVLTPNNVVNIEIRLGDCFSLSKLLPFIQRDLL